MFKKYFAIFVLSTVASIPVFAEDSVFSSSESENFSLKPLTYTTNDIPVEKSAPATVTSAVKEQDVQLSNQNFLNAINNLDNAQVELRDQLASYGALMAQSKTSYEVKRDEYRGYKKQYNAIKRKIDKIEKSKKLIQSNVYVNATEN